MIETNISTNENLVQDNSSIECVSTETTQTNTIQNDELIFGQKHNDIECALCPTAKRACDRAWVTAKQIENWSGMSTMTLWRRLKKLDEVGRICSLSDLINCKMPTNNGGHQDVQLYNLNVLNQLAMVELDCPALNETSKKFSDILSEVETTGSYSVNQQQAQSVMLPNFCNPAEAARAWADLYEKNQVTELRALTAESERDETRALLAEEKERADNLERTKSWINDKKTASAMGTAGALSKKCDRLEKELNKVESERDLQIYNIREAIRKEFEEAWMRAREWCYKHGLPVSSNEPKWTVSAQLRSICKSDPDRDQCHPDASGVLLFPKWACDVLDKMYDEDETFLREYRKV